MNKEPERHDLGACARLLGWPRLRLSTLAALGGFAEPAGQQGHRPYWHAAEVYCWAMSHTPQLASRVPLQYWPDATEPAPYLGAISVQHATAIGWLTKSGELWVVWSMAGHLDSGLRNALAELRGRAAAIVEVEAGFGADGPSVSAVLPAAARQEYGIRWSELSRIIGMPMPYWPYMLRIPELLHVWEPGAAIVSAATIPELDNQALLRLAAIFDDASPGQQVLMNLARVSQHRSADSAQFELDAVEDMVRPGTTVIAATPTPVPETERNDIDEGIRRAGWLEILRRNDTLSVACVEEAMKWDGGDDFPYSNPETIDGTIKYGAEWANRLVPSPRTAAFQILEPDDSAETLIDPESDAPVIRKHRDSRYLMAAIPRRLYTESPLAEVILDDPIWVRTQDGILYPAPKHSYYGISWGYPGTGPGTLALLIDRLLDDITAPAADGAIGAAAGLEQLTEIDWPKGTVLTRAQLEAARTDQPRSDD